MKLFSLALLASASFTAADIISLLAYSKEGNFLGFVDTTYGISYLTTSLQMGMTYVHQNDTVRDNVKKFSHNWISYESDYLTFNSNVDPAEVFFDRGGKMVVDKKLWLCEEEKAARKRADAGNLKRFKRSDEQPAANCKEVEIYAQELYHSVALEVSGVEGSADASYLSGVSAFLEEGGRSFFAASPGFYTPLVTKYDHYRAMSAGKDSQDVTVIDGHLALTWDFEYLKMACDKNNVVQLPTKVYACEGFQGANENSKNLKMIMLGDYSGFEKCLEVKIRVIDAAGNHVRD